MESVHLVIKNNLFLHRRLKRCGVYCGFLFAWQYRLLSFGAGVFFMGLQLMVKKRVETGSTL